MDWSTLYGSGQDAAYIVTIAPATGLELSRVSITGANAYLGTNGIAFDPTGTTLYVVLRPEQGEGRRLATVNPTTGVAVEIGTLEDSIAGIAFAPSGQLYALSGQNTGPKLYVVDTGTAALTQVGEDLLNNQENSEGEAMAYDWGAGLIYRLNGNDPYNLYSIVPATGVETEIAMTDPPARWEATAATYHPPTGDLHFTDRRGNLLGFTGAGAVTDIGGPAAGTYLKGLTWGP